MKIDDWIVDEIKDALRDCPDIAAVNLCARHYSREVAALQKSRVQHHKTMAIQIKNLAAYKRDELRRKAK